VALAELRAQFRVFAAQRGHFRRFLHLRAQFLAVDGFRAVGKRPGAHLLHRRLDRSVAGDDDHERRRFEGQGVAQHRRAIHLGHPQVGHDHVHRLLIQDADRLAPAIGGDHMVLRARKDRHERRQGVWLVINDQKVAGG